MFISSKSRLGMVAGGRAGRRWCLAASLATIVLPTVAAHAAQSSVSAFRVGTEERVAPQNAGQQEEAVYKGPGHGTGGGSQRPSATYATADSCYDAAGKPSSFFAVFVNDSIRRGSKISWTTAFGTAELGPRPASAQQGGADDGEWGFIYKPSTNNNTDEILYRITSPGTPRESSETKVTVELGTEHAEGCY